MMRQNFPNQEGSGDYVPPSLQNIYLSPPARNGQQTFDIFHTSPAVPHPTSYNDKLSPMTTSSSQNVLSSSHKNYTNVENHRTIDKEQGHKIKVNIVENNAIHGNIMLFLRILTPQNTNPGCKERLHILLTGQYRGKSYTSV